MGRMYKHERLLLSLAKAIPKHTRGYLSREEAYAELKRITLQDFGYNVWRWRLWFMRKRGRDAVPGHIKDPTRKERHITTYESFSISSLITLMSVSLSKDHMWLVPEEALEVLKRRTGQDFGFDIDAWKAWLAQNPDEDASN